MVPLCTPYIVGFFKICLIFFILFYNEKVKKGIFCVWQVKCSTIRMVLTCTTGCPRTTPAPTSTPKCSYRSESTKDYFTPAPMSIPRCSYRSESTKDYFTPAPISIPRCSYRSESKKDYTCTVHTCQPQSVPPGRRVLRTTPAPMSTPRCSYKLESTKDFTCTHVNPKVFLQGREYKGLHPHPCQPQGVLPGQRVQRFTPALGWSVEFFFDRTEQVN